VTPHELHAAAVWLREHVPDDRADIAAEACLILAAQLREKPKREPQNPIAAHWGVLTAYESMGLTT
jgi:hypothetical protein